LAWQFFLFSSNNIYRLISLQTARVGTAIDAEDLLIMYEESITVKALNKVEVLHNQVVVGPVFFFFLLPVSW